MFLSATDSSVYNAQVFDGYRNRFWQSEEMAGIRVIRVWSYSNSTSLDK